MPRNPFANPLFLPVFLRVMLLIVVGLAAVLLSQRRSLKVWRRSTLFLRARTWFVIGPLFVLAVFIGGFVAFLLATFVVVQGCSEFARIAGIERRYAYLLILWGELGLLVAALARDFFGFLPFGFFIALTLLPILSGQITDAHRQVADTLVGYVFVALPMAYIVLVKSAEPYGLEFLVIVTVAVALSDIAAYATGSALRGRKLMPRVDPTKTWGGVLGNLVGAAVGVGWLWVAVPPEWSVAAVVVLVLVIAFGSVWADLTGSFIQRAFRTEVRSTVILGYGGVLNRVDSLLMAFPLSYFALLLVNKLLDDPAGRRDRPARLRPGLDPAAPRGLSRRDQGPAVHGEEQAERLAVRVGRPLHELVQDGQHPVLELLPRRLVEGQGEPVEAGGGVRAGLLQLGQERLQHRLAGARLGGDVAVQAERPGPAGGAVGLLERALLALADLLGDEEPGGDQGADVVQDRARVAAEPLGQLLVGQRLVEAEPQDAHAQGVGEGLGLFRGRRASFHGLHSID